MGYFAYMEIGRLALAFSNLLTYHQIENEDTS